MNAFNLLGILVSFVLGCVAMYVLKPFLGTYSAKKGENLATKEDIAELTRIAEGIKAKISDDVWDRQKQWEMRRDAVSDAWRALRELEISLIELHSVFLLPICESSMRHRAREQFNSCNTRYLHAKDFADLIVGKEFPKYLAAYFQQVGIIANEILKENPGYFTSERMKELAEKSNEIVQEARNELNIKSTDCAVA